MALTKETTSCILRIYLNKSEVKVGSDNNITLVTLVRLGI